MMDEVYIEDLLAPNYDELLYDVMDHVYTYYVLKGGRGSLKSSFIGIAIILLLIQPGNEKMHAICFRKTSNTLRDSVFSQLQSAIELLGLDGEFICRVSPMKITRKKTGQVILFRGVDDRAKLKSLKHHSGILLSAGLRNVTRFLECPKSVPFSSPQCVVATCSGALCRSTPRKRRPIS